METRLTKNINGLRIPKTFNPDVLIEHLEPALKAQDREHLQALAERIIVRQRNRILALLIVLPLVAILGMLFLRSLVAYPFFPHFLLAAAPDCRRGVLAV